MSTAPESSDDGASCPKSSHDDARCPKSSEDGAGWGAAGFQVRSAPFYFFPLHFFTFYLTQDDGDAARFPPQQL